MAFEADPGLLSALALIPPYLLHIEILNSTYGEQYEQIRVKIAKFDHRSGGSHSPAGT
jgi:hypothetical protein